MPTILDNKLHNKILLSAIGIIFTFMLSASGIAWINKIDITILKQLPDKIEEIKENPPSKDEFDKINEDLENHDSAIKSIGDDIDNLTKDFHGFEQDYIEEVRNQIKVNNNVLIQLNKISQKIDGTTFIIDLSEEDEEADLIAE